MSRPAQAETHEAHQNDEPYQATCLAPIAEPH